MKNLGGLEYEFSIAVSIEGHMQCFFHSQVPVEELNSFSPSIKNTASESVFSCCFLSV